MKTIYFRVEVVRPDQRAFRQNCVELIPADAPLLVGIDLSDESFVKDEILSLAGLRNMMDTIDNYFVDSVHDLLETEDDDWGEAESDDEFSSNVEEDDDNDDEEW